MRGAWLVPNGGLAVLGTRVAALEPVLALEERPHHEAERLGVFVPRSLDVDVLLDVCDNISPGITWPPKPMTTSLASTRRRMSASASSKRRAQSNARVSTYMRNLESSGWMTKPDLSIIEAKGEAYGTNIWTRTYRGDSSYGGVHRVGHPAAAARANPPPPRERGARPRLGHRDPRRRAEPPVLEEGAIQRPRRARSAGHLRLTRCIMRPGHPRRVSARSRG